MNNIGIYKIENSINGDMYIGQAVNLRTRKSVHLSTLRSNAHRNIHLQRAYNKYGNKNFIFKVILFCEKSELLYYEQKLVDKLHPQYNIRKDCVESQLGVKHSAESVKRQADAIRGRKHSDETRMKMSASRKGEKHPMFGKLHSEETKSKMSDAHLGKKRKPYSIETRERLSQAIKLWWKNRKVGENT